MSISVCISSSTVLTIFVFASKPRCVMIRFVKLLERSTFDCSKKPELTDPSVPDCGVPTVAMPLFALGTYKFDPVWLKPLGLEKLANAT